MLKPGTISSAANPLVKDVRRAIARGGLTGNGWCVAESFHLLAEALRSLCRIHAVLAAESVAPQLPPLGGVHVSLLPDALMQSIAATETSQGVIALVEPPAFSWDALFAATPLVVVLDCLQDPGNAGAILRAAEAFGATGAVFVKGTVSPFNPKTLRASAGSLFRVPFLHAVDADLARAEFARRGVALYAAVPASERALDRAPLVSASAIVIGNEARGVDPAWRAVSGSLTIPTVGVESLNAAVAAAIILYEARRQRSPHESV